jgi:hypothetical protein
MRVSKLAAILYLSLVAPAAWAQSSQPYAGLQDRKIKSLSDEQIADLKAGRDAGLALAAELNGYPGPLHVLELADKLGLSSDQKESVQRLAATMKDEAIRIGEQLLDAEEDLNRSFAAGTITQDQVEDQTRAIAVLWGKLRATHLGYHLVVAKLLTPVQVARYNELRGYAGGGGHDGPHHEHMRQR